MKITETMINLPPYISTSWNMVSALYMKGSLLVIILREGDIVNIPGLSQEIINLIFSMHATFIEKHAKPAQTEHSVMHQVQTSSAVQEFPFKFGISGLDGMGVSMQHNPAHADMPDLPDEILNKITSIAKIIAPEDSGNLLPKPELHCNCPFCQISKAIHLGLDKQEIAVATEPVEENVSDADLQFQQWIIDQTGDKLFSVVNKLDTKEKYSVYLGHPVGCTCGKQGCEHILAVLRG